MDRLHLVEQSKEKLLLKNLINNAESRLV